MDDLGKFSLIESFGVDNSELDGLSKQLCFVLGVEWEMIRQKVDSGQSFEQSIHSENMERIEALCNRRGMSYKIIPHDDWPTLIVGA